MRYKESCHCEVEGNEGRGDNALAAEAAPSLPSPRRKPGSRGEWQAPSRGPWIPAFAGMTEENLGEVGPRRAIGVNEAGGGNAIAAYGAP